MRYKEAFIKTKKEEPTKEEISSAKLLLQAGFIEKNAAGIYSYLPLGFRVLKKIEEVIRYNFNQAQISEIKLPILQPAKPWRETNRWRSIGDELWKIKSKKNEDFVLSFTAEELIVDLLRDRINSYKNLPIILNQIQPKIRDEMRPRGGLIRLREFVMQDAYSFDQDEVGMEKSFKKISIVYNNIFKELELNPVEVEADPGNMGGSKSHEFMLPSSIGEDRFVRCSKCNYKANIETAECIYEPSTDITKKETKIEEINTPNIKSIEQLNAYLGESPQNMIKVVVYRSGKDLIMVATRGDLDINEKKLSKLLGQDVKIASEDELDRWELVPGFVSPYDLKNKKIKVFADRSLKLGGPYITGANKRDRHYRGVNVSDLRVDQWVDVVGVTPGCHCIRCGGKLKIEHAIELGHIFQLGTFYSNKMKFYYQDISDSRQHIWMGSYGIGLDRLVAAIVEAKHDKKGIIWPRSCAPFDIYLINLSDSEDCKKIALNLEKKLENSGFDVLFDDRECSAGIKFADCDLIGAPIRITVSKRTVSRGGVEIKKRTEDEYKIIKYEKVKEVLKEY